MHFCLATLLLADLQGMGTVDPRYRQSSSQMLSLFTLQGDMDEVVPFAHGQALHAAAKNPYPPLWACGYGHQNLEFCKQYLPSLHEYLRKLFGRDYGML